MTKGAFAAKSRMLCWRHAGAIHFMPVVLSLDDGWKFSGEGTATGGLISCPQNRDRNIV